jgi:hypothetical protein
MEFKEKFKKAMKQGSKEAMKCHELHRSIPWSLND